MGNEVGRLLIPTGFRVTLSQNAVDFGHVATKIAAPGENDRAGATGARCARGRPCGIPCSIGHR